MFYDLNFPGVHTHISSGSHIDGLWGHNALQITSEDASDFKIELSGLKNLVCHTFLALKSLFEINATEEDFYHPLTCSALWGSLLKTNMAAEMQSWMREFSTIDVAKMWSDGGSAM